MASRDTGFAYEGYVALKLSDVRASVSKTIVALRGAAEQSPFFPVVSAILDAWAIDPEPHMSPRGESPDGLAKAPTMPNWIKFLQAFDVDYQRRRLRFMVEGLNRIYRELDESRRINIDHAAMNGLKRGYYDCLGAHPCA